MKREIDINEITDGRRYQSTSMVRIGCDNCQGCSACCRGMGTSVVLDPYDIAQLTHGLGQNFEELMARGITLSQVDGILLPVLNMGGKEEQCFYLDQEGRCSIHAFRPGICRLFPLGRIYEEDHFAYIHQIHECKKGGRSKVKIASWLGIPQLKQYEKYIMDWHDLLRGLEEELAVMNHAEQMRTIQLMLLHLFFRTPYDAQRDFYSQFYERLAKIR